MSFVSDNCFGTSPEILAALAGANHGAVPSYGNDDLTLALQSRFRDLFETDCVVLPVSTGTAANAISLAAIAKSGGIIYCHDNAHIYEHEAGAVEHMAHGCRLVPVAGNDARMDGGRLARLLEGLPRTNEYMPPVALSVSQATERGTAYTVDEIRALTEIAREHDLLTHMDGARFANALVARNASPAEMTWKAGIDVLSFGTSKNGTLNAEAIVLFKPELSAPIKHIWKRSGHVTSKMRFLSAQIHAYLDNDLWLRNARHANEAAQKLAAGLLRLPGVRLHTPVDTNAVFVDLPASMFDRMPVKTPNYFGDAEPGYRRARYLTSFATTEDDIAAFLEAAEDAATAVTA